MNILVPFSTSPGGGNGNPLQSSCLENPMDRGAWRAVVHGVTKSWTRLCDWAQCISAVQPRPHLVLQQHTPQRKTRVHLRSASLPPIYNPHTHSAAAAAAAKSLQSCPTLSDPIDGSPSGSPIPGILQARALEWVAISFSNAWKWKVKVKSLSRVRLLLMCLFNVHTFLLY